MPATRPALTASIARKGGSIRVDDISLDFYPLNADLINCTLINHSTGERREQDIEPSRFVKNAATVEKRIARLGFTPAASPWTLLS
jgi:riboflavin synthase alpha subunit